MIKDDHACQLRLTKLEKKFDAQYIHDFTNYL